MTLHCTVTHFCHSNCHWTFVHNDFAWTSINPYQKCFIMADWPYIRNFYELHEYWIVESFLHFDVNSMKIDGFEKAAYCKCASYRIYLAHLMTPADTSQLNRTHGGSNLLVYVMRTWFMKAKKWMPRWCISMEYSSSDKWYIWIWQIYEQAMDYSCTILHLLAIRFPRMLGGLY